MKFPPHLSPGDRVSIISPAGKVDRRFVERGARLLRQFGFDVVVGPHACGEHGVFSASDAARADDMQRALDDPSIKAIFFSRGGYGCLRTHLLLDWSSFLLNPKWLVGFSDITVFHAYLARQKIASIHGVMTSRFEADEAPTQSFLQVMDLLAGKAACHVLPPHELNRTGKASGVLTGGNLSIIQSLRGTPLDIRPKGKILFIEDIHELHYHLDRMMQNLKAGGVLEQLSGLLVGHFTAMRDGATPFGRTAAEIIMEAVEPYDYPVVFGFPSGHEMPNQPLLMGARVTLDVSAAATRLGNPEGSIDRAMPPGQG